MSLQPASTNSSAAAPGPLRLTGRRRGLLFICILGALAIGIAASSYAPLHRRQLVGGLAGDEHEAAAPREELEKMLGPRAVPFFRGLLNHPEPGVRFQAVEALLEIQGQESLPEIFPLMHDYHARIRQRITEAASRWETPETYQLLLASSQDPDLWVRQAAVFGLADGLRRRNDRRAETLYALARAVDDPDLAVSSSAMGAMRQLAHHDFGFRIRESGARQRAAVKAWREWWIAHRPRPEPELPGPVPVGTSAPAPHIVVTDISGQRWSLPDNHRRPALVHFFGTWCGSCIPEMEELEKLHRQYPELRMLALGIGEQNDGDMRRYAEKHRITFPMALAPDRVVQDYGDIHEVPVSYVIDSRGRVRRRYDGTRDLGTFLASVKDLTRTADSGSL